MKIKSRWHSFSLVELVIVLAVVGILAAAVIFALGNSQRTARDEDRKVTAAKITTMINDVFRVNSSFPTVSNVVWSTNSVSVSGTILPLSGYLKYSSSQTDASQTRYYYARDSVGFLLCVRLESGMWYRTGTGISSCPSN